MKFPKEVNEDASDSKKGYQKRNVINERKLSDEKKERSGNKFEENCILEPNATALVPPWLRNSLGLNEKMKTASKTTNQKGFKNINESHIPKLEEPENKTYSGGDLIESNVYSQDHSSDNHCGEVNSPRNPGKIPSLWRNKTARQNQCDCNIFKSSYKCRSNGRTLKSESTSLNLMNLIDGQSLPEKEKYKSRSQKLKGRIFRKNSFADQKCDKMSKTESRVFQDADSQEVLHSSSKNDDFNASVSIKDTNVLLLYGKSETDGLTQDFFLLKEMKDQNNSNEDSEKLSGSIKRIIAEDVSSKRELNLGREIKDFKDGSEQKEGIEKAKYEVPHLSKTESENERINTGQSKSEDIDSKNKDADEERKHWNESRKPYEKKNWRHQKFMKFSEEAKYKKQISFGQEPENEKMLESKIREVSKKFKEGISSDSSAEKMNKSRQFDAAFIEKMVSDILQKLTELYRFQITPDKIRIMKSNIIHVIESELREFEDRKNSEEIADNLFTLQESFKSRDENINDLHSSTVEEKEDKVVESFRKTLDAALISKKGSLIPSPLVIDQNSLLKLSADNNEDKKNHCTHLIDNIKEKKIGRENDVMENENIKDLRKEFEKCLNLIQAQLDITGTKLCSIVLEKIEAEDLANKKVKIIHNNAKGVTEAIRIYNERTLNLPDGDGASMKTCKYPQKSEAESCKPELKCSQLSQTMEKTFLVNSTQTEFSVIVVTEENNENFLLENNDFLNESDAEQLLESLEMAMETSNPENGVRNISAESGTSIESKIEKDKESILKSISRETSVSEKGLSSNVDSGSITLRRKIKSYCNGLNYLEEARKKFPKNYSLYKCNLNFDVASANGMEAEKQKEAEKRTSKDEKDCVELKAEEIRSQKTEEDKSSIILYWNGKKMDPGTDLKIHVENLIREKIKEILEEVKINEQKGVMEKSLQDKIENYAFETTEGRDNGTEKNFDAEKDRSIFSFSGNDVANPSPHFDCISSNNKVKCTSDEAKASNEDGGPVAQSKKSKEKFAHDVGIQSSQHSLLSSNMMIPKPKSRLCTVSKTRKHKIKKEFFEPVITNSGEKVKDVYVKTKLFNGSENKTNRVKVEFREADKDGEETQDETLAIIPADYSSTSNDSSGGSHDKGRPVRVKVIGIELSKKESKSPSEGDGSDNVKTNESVKFSVEDLLKIPNQRTNESSISGMRGYKHWKLIENLLNRVDWKENDELWNDVRQFVRGKIGRDMNEDGTHQICIELEQDIPKFKKGRSSGTVIGKGNYRRKEGDLEVEVDLTLEDLERIMRHRDKNLRRRRYQKKKTKQDVKRSSNSSVTSAGVPSYCGPRYYGKSGNMHRSESVPPSDTTK